MNYADAIDVTPNFGFLIDYSEPSNPVVLPQENYAIALIPATEVSFNRSATSELAHEFHRRANQWKQETAKLSLVQKRAVHPSYQRIIGMGREALPFIFRELNDRRDDWLWALSAITGIDDVVKPDSTFDEAIDQWLLWGIEQGYLLPNQQDAASRNKTSIAEP